MKLRIKVLAGVLSMVCGLGALVAQETAAEEEKGIGLETWASLSAGDAFSGFDLCLDVGASYTLGFGLVLGIDAIDLPLYPSFGFGPLGIFEEYDIVFGDSGFDVNIGNSNSFSFGSGLSVDGGLYAILGYSALEQTIASLELDPAYLAANDLAFGLGGIVGGGWSFALGSAGELALWAEACCDIVGSGGFAFTGADLAIDYIFDLAGLSLDLCLNPGIDAAGSFSLPISLKATYSF